MTKLNETVDYKILVLNGPNLNLLGIRELEVYGAQSLARIIEDLESYAHAQGCKLRHFQSNSEGALIDAIHEAIDWADGIVFNPGGYTHTSVSLRDAISGCKLPVVETHLSNIHAREDFRKESKVAGACIGVVAGFGAHSYRIALGALLLHLSTQQR